MTAIETPEAPPIETNDIGSGDSTPPRGEATPRRRPPSTGEIDIKVAGLTKVFKDFWFRKRVTAVDKLDFEVRRGEIFGLLGPNGSGKSTTIKMLLGLLRPTAGKIAVLGKRAKDVENKKRIGYLPEESYLYRFLNARETLDYYGRLFHQAKSQRNDRTEMLLEMVGLQSVQHRPVGEYSKGMQRRIGLAQALINDPQLLILDEPTTGMDPLGTRQIKDLILKLAERGKTVLLCSHQLSDVQDVCDRVAIMYGGKLRVEGTCDELLTASEYTDVRMAAASPEVIEELAAVLKKHGLAMEGVHSPRQTLEELFLDVVEKAKQDRIETAGAQSGGQIAAFLATEAATPPREEQRTGEELVDDLLVKKPEPVEESFEAATPTEVEPTAQDDLIAGLVDKKEPEPKSGEIAEEKPKEDADLGLIDGLLGGEKKDR